MTEIIASGGATTPGEDTAAAKGGGPELMHPLKNRAKRDAIIDAVGSLDLTKRPAWEDLNRLSQNTVVEAIDVVPEGIFELASGKFAAAATVFVALNHGDGDAGFDEADSFPMTVCGHFGLAGEAIVDETDIETRSIFA